MALEGLPPDADDPNLVAPKEPDRLEAITTALRRVRELKLDLEDWERRRKDANIELNELVFRRLPDLFQAAHTTTLGLAPEGNLPGYMAALKPYYKANISAEWPPEQQAAGYATLRELNGADLVRNTVTVEFGRGEDEAATLLTYWLQEHGLLYTRGQAVPWNTLTAWIREQCTKFKREFTREQLEALGATVGHVVEVKPIKS